MSDYLRVTRVCDLMARYAEQKISRGDLCHRVTTRLATMNGRHLTRLWPEIEANLGNRDLYAIRPSGRADYGVCATTNPLIALMSMKDREKNVVTRLNNDVRGEVLAHLAATTGRSAVSAALQLERARVYLDAYYAQQAGIDALVSDAIGAYNRLPWATLVASDTLPWE